MSYCVIKRTLEETSLFVSRDVGSCYQDYYYSLAVHVLKYTGGLCRVRARRHVSSLSQSLNECTNPILTRPHQVPLQLLCCFCCRCDAPHSMMVYDVDEPVLCTALVCYDCLTTLSLEVRVFWNRSPSIAALLYFANRYTALVVCVYNISAGNAPTQLVSESLLLTSRTPLTMPKWYDCL